MFIYDEEKNVIETERLVLRRFVMDDAEKVAAICNTEEVWKGTLALHHPTSGRLTALKTLQFTE